MKESSLNSEQTSNPSSKAPTLSPSVDGRVVRGGRFAAVLVTLSLLVIAFVLVFFYPRLFVTIHAGERGVMWSRWTGTDMNAVYLEGTQFVWPWNKLTIYDVRFKLAKKTVSLISKDGLTVTMKMMVRYRPADKLLPALHETVGPNYVEVVVLPEVVRGLRGVVSQFTLEEFYRQKFTEIREMMLERARVEGGKRYVIVDDVVFEDIKLPEGVEQAIQHKMQQEQQALEMKYVLDMARSEAERKVIEAKGIEEQQAHINNTLTDRILKYKSIDAMRDLAASPNSKIVVMGNDSGGKGAGNMMLNMGDQPTTAKTPAKKP